MHIRVALQDAINPLLLLELFKWWVRKGKGRTGLKLHFWTASKGWQVKGH